jgi:hypothetical protein
MNFNLIHNICFKINDEHMDIYYIILSIYLISQ